MTVMAVVAVIMIVGYVGDDCVDFEGCGEGNDCDLSTDYGDGSGDKMTVTAVMTVKAVEMVMGRTQYGLW